MDVSMMAAKIVAARKSGIQAQMDWPDPAPTIDDAQTIQRVAFELLDSPSVGWKVGATNPAAREKLGIGAPFFGPMPQSGVMDNGAVLEKTPCIGACEPEYAFKMARDFPVKAEEITVQNATDAVECLHIAIEVIGRRVGNSDFANGIGVTMDFAGNAVFVVGPEVVDWQSRDLAAGVVESKIDGSVVETGSGGLVMGDPINSLVWLAKTLAESGRQLKAGQWVSTGTCTPAVPAQAGRTYSARFSDFGEVSVVFS
jgi:2-keto-4-pentenoate hydratase